MRRSPGLHHHPGARKAEGAYDQSPEPKYLLVLDKATHLAWADIGWKRARGQIVGYSLAFLNRYVEHEGDDSMRSCRPAQRLGDDRHLRTNRRSAALRRIPACSISEAPTLMDAIAGWVHGVDQS
jgi:hypothetical protein